MCYRIETHKSVGIFCEEYLFGTGIWPNPGIHEYTRMTAQGKLQSNSCALKMSASPMWTILFS